jgi:peptide/nickel transport system substrate-binding protein
VALQPGLSPNWIFPIFSTSYAEYNDQNWFEWLMWRPMFWYGSNGKITFNQRLSFAYRPTYSNGGRTVTVKLKHYQWSDGRPITNRDVEFFFNLLKAAGPSAAAYVPGEFPFNVVSASFPASDPYSFSMTFNRRYNPAWLLGNELDQLIPLPQHVWDRRSLTGPVGNYDLTAGGARAVYAFLTQQSKQGSTYVTSPLWRVVDGPWRLASYDPSTGRSAFVPNPKYSGPDHPKLARFEEIPFTSSSSEFQALLAGQVDYGYLPPPDVGAQSQLAAKGYSLHAWPYFGVNYAIYNYSNPTAGPLFAQQYIRSAIQHLVNQQLIIKHVYHGYATATYGPVPTAGGYATKADQTNPYPFSVAAAISLLRQHGWNIVPNGIDTCVSPGTGAAQCGLGIPRGTKLSLQLQYATGFIEVTTTVSELQSAFGAAGFQLRLRPYPNPTIYTNIGQECPKSPTCPWNMAYYYPGGWYWGMPSVLPTGDVPFTTAGASVPGWNNPALAPLALLPAHGTGLSGLSTYENVLNRLAPVMWLPTPPTQLSEISGHLHGVLPQDPGLTISPQDWYLTK